MRATLTLTREEIMISAAEALISVGVGRDMITVDKLDQIADLWPEITKKDPTVTSANWMDDNTFIMTVNVPTSMKQKDLETLLSTTENGDEFFCNPALQVTGRSIFQVLMEKKGEDQK